MPSPDVYWLALRTARGVGPRTCKLLIEKFGAPEKIFELHADEIAAAGVPRNTARSIAEFRDFEPLEKELCELPNIGARLVKWTDPDYPPNLRQIADPPPFLFVRGRARSAIPPASRSSALARPAISAGGWRSGSASSSPPRASPW